MSTTEEQIKKMYASQLKSQKEQLDTDYAGALSQLDEQQQKNAKATDANLNRTAVEAQKAAVGSAELQNAYGLSSGAQAQARLARENQLQADMTAIRTAQQNADADIERQRSLFAQEYAAAIRQAQAENDLAKAEALYQNARDEEARLLARQEAAAKESAARQEAAAKLMAEATGDYSRLGALYGLSEEEIAALSGATDEPPTAPANPVDFDSAEKSRNAQFASEIAAGQTENARKKRSLLDSARSMSGSATAIANSIVVMAANGDISASEAAYLLDYFGYAISDYFE